MMNYSKLSFGFKKYRILILGYIPIMFTVFFTAFMLLRFPETAGQGITDGIDLCLGTLIPSLYPFMVLSSLTVNLRLMNPLQKYLSGVTDFLFALPGKCIGVIILSMVGGLPIGGKMTKELYERGEISRSQGRRMLLFCMNPGPAFVISSVGFYMLGSKQAGVIIFLSLLLSSLILGILSRFFENEDSVYLTKTESTKESTFSSALVKSVSDGSVGMLLVCAWVILFSCINRLVEILPLQGSAKFFSYCILEMTNGCLMSAGNLSVPIIAGIIGFGGICGHFQVMSAVTRLGLKYKYFLTARVINAALAVVISHFLLRVFPVSYEVFSSALPRQIHSGVSVPISIGMLLMCAVFLLGDGAVFRVRRGKKANE